MIHFFIEGSCIQYKQKGSFSPFSTKLDKRAIKAGIFFKASHGKGSCDVVSAALPRIVDMLISHSRDFQDARKLFKALLEIDTSKFNQVLFCQWQNC